MLRNIFPSKPEIKQKRQKWYQFYAQNYGQAKSYFMNYGYQYDDPPVKPIILDASEEKLQFQIQLYHYVVSPIDLEGRTVLEVGCGGGAGAAYVMRHLKPKAYTGLDFAVDAVRACNKNQSYKGLAFIAGDAEALPFKDESFDVVINVESCHGYISLGNFLDHVSRVLVPGGYFFLVDFRGKHEVDVLQQAIQNSGLSVLSDNLITGNVLVAMRSQQQDKEDFLETLPEELRLPLREFIGAKGSEIFEGLRNGTAVYVSYVLQKKTN